MEFGSFERNVGIKYIIKFENSTLGSKLIRTKHHEGVSSASFHKISKNLRKEGISISQDPAFFLAKIADCSHMKQDGSNFHL